MDEIRLARDVAAEILNHARSNPDEECCGLLAGRDSAIRHAFSARNVADRPAVAYEIAPKELFRLMRAYFIISPRADEPQPVRAYSIREGRWAELQIEIQV